MLGASAAYADGGLLRLSQPAGPFEISVFTAPTPLRVGAADVSVLLLEQAGRAPVLDADVNVTLRLGAVTRSASATRTAATNKLLYAALLDLPEPGTWALEVQVRNPAGAATISTTFDVAPPLSAWITFWPYLVAPAVAIALFAIHQRLKRDQIPPP